MADSEAAQGFSFDLLLLALGVGSAMTTKLDPRTLRTYRQYKHEEKCLVQWLVSVVEQKKLPERVRNLT